nr:alpha/beta hydrolases superfamily protein [Tanacetum cinerariifolium]
DKIPMVNRNLAVAFANKGISAFRFDFAGNGDSGGSFQYRNNYREVDDLRSVIQCFEQEKWFVTAIIGYSKGGNVVLFYAFRFKDVNNVINISHRFDLKEVLLNFDLIIIVVFMDEGVVKGNSKLGTFHSVVVFLGALNQNAVHPLVALENIVFYHERVAGMYLLLPYALAQIRAFVDRLIERHMAMKTDTKSEDSSYASKDSQKETRDARDMLSVSI